VVARYSGLPSVTVRSAPAIVFPRPAQHLLTLWPARSPSQPSYPLHRKLRQLRCLCCRFDCYRVERTSSRAGVAPTEVQRLSRRTVTSTIANLRPYFRYPRTIAGLKNVVRRNWLQRIHKYPDDGQDSCAMRQPTPEPSTLRITKANYGARSTNRWLGQAIVSMPGRIR